MNQYFKSFIKMIMRWSIEFIKLMGLMCIFTSILHAETACHGRLINPFTDICWNCLFPITIGTVKMGDRTLPDTQNSHQVLCVCEHHPFPIIGITMGYWEPMALVDVTRVPYCLVNLGGTQLRLSDAQEGAVEANTATESSAFYYVHYYNFPVVGWFAGWLLGGSCKTDGAFLAPAYFSELDPTWRNEQLSSLLFPETRQFQNPLAAISAEAVCAADAVAANVGLPNDSSYWCAGSQGFMYPLTGRVAERTSTLQSGTLLTERAIFKLHRLFLIPDTSAQDCCHEHNNLLMNKSRYRYQMAYPTVAACQPFGRSTMRWGSGKLKMTSSDDMGFVIWRKRSCCNY